MGIINRTYSVTYFNDNEQHSSLKYLHVECQCLSTNSWACLLDEAVIASALPWMMAIEICLKKKDIWWGSLVALKMRQPMSVKREHAAEPMIPDVSTATGTNSKSATS